MFPPDVTFNAWEQAGRHISRVINSSAWCLGDWLVYGQERYSDRYRRAIVVVGLDYQTLRNYAWVTRRFEMSRRRERLSFQHHAEVASLPIDEQERWLDCAEEQGWSKTRLRRRIREERRDEPASTPTALLPRVAISTHHLESWRRAAEQAETDLGQWMVDTLDQAAAKALATSQVTACEPVRPELPGG